MSKSKFYAVRGENWYEVWERVGRNRVRVCEMMSGRLKDARNIARLLDEQAESEQA